MAVKVTAQITLSCVVDVKATYRYYLLQSSTLSKPAKPTVFPPNTTWGDAEPSYAEGSTDSLYFVDCTVFCDDTFNYSEVSLSSSYEAAKAAYNKATNAQNTADDAQQGILDLDDRIHQSISEKETSIISTTEEIILSALESYVETSDYDSFKETVETQLSVMSDELSINFTNAIAQTNDVNDSLQSFIGRFTKYIRFTSETAITIGSGDSAITLEIDNDTGIIFKKNGEQFGWWDGVDFHTGNIVVEVHEQARFGDFAFVPRSDGSLCFYKVGG